MDTRIEYKTRRVWRAPTSRVWMIEGYGYPSDIDFETPEAVAAALYAYATRVIEAGHVLELMHRGCGMLFEDSKHPQTGKPLRMCGGKLVHEFRAAPGAAVTLKRIPLGVQVDLRTQMRVVERFKRTEKRTDTDGKVWESIQAHVEPRTEWGVRMLDTGWRIEAEPTDVIVGALAPYSGPLRLAANRSGPAAVRLTDPDCGGLGDVTGAVHVILRYDAPMPEAPDEAAAAILAWRNQRHAGLPKVEA